MTLSNEENDSVRCSSPLIVVNLFSFVSVSMCVPVDVGLGLSGGGVVICVLA